MDTPFEVLLSERRLPDANCDPRAGTHRVGKSEESFRN